VGRWVYRLDTDLGAREVEALLLRIAHGVYSLIRVWRLRRARHAAFDGEGAWRRDGRWNHLGTRVVYASASLPPVISSEQNYLLNSAHPGFRTIRIGRSQPFSFDPRMWETKPTR
jgi:RES domain-containing protein